MTAVNTGDIRLWVEANSLPASVRAQVLALCDALDATRTERDSWQADVESLHRDLAHSMDRIAEEMASVEAEREQTRQLFQFLIEWDGQGSIRDPDYRDQLQERYCAWIATAEAALATAGGEGAKT